MNSQPLAPSSQVRFVDTHCHIHESDYPLSVEETLKHAADAGVSTMVVVGTSNQSSADAVKFAVEHKNTFATVGVHPHDTKDGYDDIADLAKQKTVVAVGEIGLDYFYNHSPREVQISALETQVQIALDNDLPIVFHVREAFDDFWPVFDNFSGLRGVLHSFTDNQKNLDKAFERGLLVGINGISTFTKNSEQQKLYANIPIDRMVLETDAPFLAPIPHRGTTNEPARIVNIAQHHARLRGISLEELATTTTQNAEKLFRI